MPRLTSVVTALLLFAAPLAAQSPAHPLDGLSGREHWTIYDALRASGRTDSTASFLYVGLNEPPKSEAPKRPPVTIRQEDVAFYRELGKTYREILGLKKELSVSSEPG